ncbi:MAG: type I DNA topoisomerase [FCB group bacterium]|nr:type I DNA topoisomerase [FCB group bacterium]
MDTKPLLIVESPSKARTIEKYLGGEYRVLASVGHIKDLPKRGKAVDIENNFETQWVVLPDKKGFVKELKKSARESGSVFIATDPDREGEAIAAHIASEIPDVKPLRVRFNEITPKAIREALESPASIDDHLVEAQLARRILDRLVGYEVSPILWPTLGKSIRWVKEKFSAGRVQSTTLRLVVERERERMRFRKSQYFDLAADLETDDQQKFTATLNRVDDVRIAEGKDFDANTGELKNTKVKLLSETDAQALKSEIEPGPWIVDVKETKPKLVRPKPPYTTSTLQQAAVRRFGSSRRVMRIAQTLYEAGFISYMRTDSTNLSAEALSGARSIIRDQFGETYLPEKAIHYKTKVKNAQEAHEAIRPAGGHFADVATVSKALGSDAARLYEMIWRRTVASQMNPAKKLQTQLEITSGRTRFRASGEILQFDGFLRVMGVGASEDALPPVEKGDQLNCRELRVTSHETKPPARFTEASLVKEMENIGIGRPSTYASTIEKLFNKEYLLKEKGVLIPSYQGIALTQLLENHFAPIIDFKFTAHMESDLDNIALGKKGYIPFLRAFWEGADTQTGLHELLDGDLNINKACAVPVTPGEDGIVLRIGHFGPYLVRDGKTKSVPFSMPLGDLNPDTAQKLLETSDEIEPLGHHPETGEPVFVKTGRYGTYVELGDNLKRKSLPKHVKPEAVDLDLAVKLLSLPREVGHHPDTGDVITADWGRFGPYLRCGQQNAKIPPSETPYDITEKTALELLSRSKKASVVLREIGIHPETQDTLVLKNGRYGPYVTDGKVNASLPKDENPETISLERCVELIEKKKAAPPKKRRKGRRK